MWAGCDVAEPRKEQDVIRLRKPTTAPPEAFVGDPPVYRETLLALVERDPTFMSDQRIAQPDGWSALDDLLVRASEEGVAA
jgi:hypothetical protein